MVAPLDQTRQQAVFDRLRLGILTGTLPHGTRLPPSRSLAEELGVSRQTVVLAYERLMAECYARARVGSGTYVAPELPDAAPPPAAPPIPSTAALSRRGALLAATPVSASGSQGGQPGLLAPGVPAPELFPAASWAAATARVLRALPPALTAYPDPQGLPVLRTEIARHLAASRGIVSDPGQIATLNRVFSLPESQVAWARRVLDAYEEATRAGKGAITVDGKMVDAASLRVARAIVQKSTLAATRNG